MNATPTPYTDASPGEVDSALKTAADAFRLYRQVSLKERARFMFEIADGLEAADDQLIQTAAQETALPGERLRAEKGRTIFQLRSYAQACQQGNWLEARIDSADGNRLPPKPDLRKMLVPLGPVVVFGSSNFPFAYSTAGGDTACAFAAGCPVIVKAHPAHAQTSALVADVIHRAAATCRLPPGIFTHLYGASFAVGEALVKHPLTKAVGFTGSYAGGKQLFDWGTQRPEPIPVFAEMGSINPVFLLPGKLASEKEEIATQYAASITLGVGQFCTNPGLLIGIEGNDLQEFHVLLGRKLQSTEPAKMLHSGIAASYHSNRKKALSQPGVTTVAEASLPAGEELAIATLATVSASQFLQNEKLGEEVFGPYSLVVRCANNTELMAVAQHLKGQLTATVMATDDDVAANEALLNEIKEKCGRFILNGVPTGVEVCLSMHHGGPFPATTDARFTSVGADGIKRFARPLVYQNFSNHLLPDELKNENPLGIYRTVNNVLTKDAIA
jgi:NADP-dependent aldehyde dehydrogenase